MVVEKLKNALVLSAVDRRAASLGLKPGQPLANARAMVPSLEVATADSHADAGLLVRIATWCDRFTPFVALDGAAGLLLDVTGVSHLFGDEQAMLEEMCARLKAQGLAAQASVAGTAAAARALARYRPGTLVEPGEEAEAVSPLPIEALPLDQKTIHAFRRAGLKTIGAAAGRKRAEVAARFGAATRALLDEAMGREQGAPLSPRNPVPDYWREKNFAEPILSQEAVEAALLELAEALAKLLERHGQGARRLEAVFFRTDGAVRRIIVEAGAPLQDTGVIIRLFRERLAALDDEMDAGFGFDLIRLAATRVEAGTPETMELQSGIGSAHDSDIGFLVDRLAARFGRQRILAFEPRNTHVPEAAWVTVPAQDAPHMNQQAKMDWGRIAAPGEAPRRPLRLFRQAEPVMLFTAPPRLAWRRVQRDMAQHEGPERIAMEWWRHDQPQPARDYVRVEDGEGHRYWLYCNASGETPEWFLHGCFA